MPTNTHNSFRHLFKIQNSLAKNKKCSGVGQIYLLLIQDFCKSGILSQKLDNYHLPRVCCDINCYLTFHFFDKRFSKCMYQIWTLIILCGLLWHQLCTLTRRITQLSGKLPSHDVMTDSSYFPSKVQLSHWPDCGHSCLWSSRLL